MQPPPVCVYRSIGPLLFLSQLQFMQVDADDEGPPLNFQFLSHCRDEVIETTVLPVLAHIPGDNLSAQNLLADDARRDADDLPDAFFKT